MEGSETLISIWGPAGVIIVALAGACIWLWRAYSTTQEARVSDAQKVVTVLLELQQRHNQLTADLTRAIEALEAGFTDLRAELRELRRVPPGGE